MWGYKILCSKKACFVAITKDSACDFYTPDHEYIHNCLQNMSAQTLSEGVYALPLSQRDAFKAMADKEKWIEDESRASKILQYMKERRSLKSPW